MTDVCKTEGKVYIVLVNWNGWQDTIECLESLAKLQYSSFRVIIVDNCSTDGSVEKIQEWAAGLRPVAEPANEIIRTKVLPFEAKPVTVKIYPVSEAQGMEPQCAGRDITIIRSAVNNGFAAGCNTGIRYALRDKTCSYVWLLNNDTVVDKKALTELVTKAASAPDYGMCGSTLIYYGQPDKVQSLGGRYNRRIAVNNQILVNEDVARVLATDEQVIEKQLDYVVGASILVGRKFIEATGLLNEELFFYFEELDWAFRSKKNFKVGYARNSLVYHKVGQSIAKERQAVGAEHYYWVRNRLLLTEKFNKRWLPLLLLHVVLVTASHALRGDWRFCRVTTRALLDGLLNRKGRLTGTL